jgi:protein SCO1
MLQGTDATMEVRNAVSPLILAVVLLRVCMGAAAGEELRLARDHPLGFIDSDGRVVRSTDFTGKWVLIYFGYTHCSDLCPTGLSVLANALDQIGPAAAHVQPLFVTVDPERDKGEVLRSFTQAFDKRLIGLGGTVEQIKAAANALGASFEQVKQGSSYVIDHSSAYVLIDPSHERAQTMRIAEPHILAAKLIEAMAKAGVTLDKVNNVGAYR